MFAVNSENVSSPVGSNVITSTVNDDDSLSEVDLGEDSESPRHKLPPSDESLAEKTTKNIAPIASLQKSPSLKSNGDINIPQKLTNGEGSSVREPIQETPVLDLMSLIKNETASSKEIVEAVFLALIGSSFDAENNYLIQNHEIILHVIHVLDECSTALQAEIWSVLIGIVRKSYRNLEICARAGIISLILERLPQSDQVVADLLIELLGVLACYSMNIVELKLFLKSLQCKANIWQPYSAKLLYVLKQMPRKEGPEIFFNFNGQRKSGIQIPPMTRWPYQNGWTFSCWLRMDPVSTLCYDRQTPYVYSFRTSKGLGYSCHFVGNCLVVTSLKTKNGKGYQLCVKFELQPRRWHHLLLGHVFGRWGKPSEVQCFVDGQLVTTLDMAWHVNTSDHFDRCYIGHTYDEEKSSFCGQLSAIYVFSESLSAQQAASLFKLGPGYQSSFKFDNEIDTLPAGYARFLFDGKLASSLVFAYCPKNCDKQLCLESSPKENVSYFHHAPHALMLEGVTIVTTHSVYSSLHSIGGTQMLLPLFDFLDCSQTNGDIDYTICSTILSALAHLMFTSPSIRQQMLHDRAFLIIGNALSRASRNHVTDHLVDTILDVAKLLCSSPPDLPLLRHLFDYVLANPTLWISVNAKAQIRIYSYLAHDFANYASFHSSTRSVSTVLQMLHALKCYYWIDVPKGPWEKKARNFGSRRPETEDIIKIRSLILAFIRKLIVRDKNMPPSTPALENKDDEVQGLLNYLTTVQEDDNLYDVLKLTISLVNENPADLIPGLDRKRGLCTIYKLLSSKSELIRLSALKLLGHFLSRSITKRKQESMLPHNLFNLLIDKLCVNMTHLTMNTYNALFQILVENMCADVFAGKVELDSKMRFENPAILKVLAKLIAKSKPCPETTIVKLAFLNDILALCRDCKENRRTILQMSVWQEWLINLAFIYPKNDEEKSITELVYSIFCSLLHHAIKFEYGGWRVWVDTLAIAHSKVSFEKFKLDSSINETLAMPLARRQSRKMSSSQSLLNDDHDIPTVVRCKLEEIVNEVCLRVSAARPSYRIPEFCWSHVHIRLLNDVLSLIETDLAEWRSSSGGVLDHANDQENAIFVVNTVHIVSQLVDNLIMACGGLLPLLAAATSPNSDLEIVDSTQQNLSMELAVRFLIRFVHLIDVMVFTTAINFGELEQEKNINAGGILRQCLRLVCTMSVCNNLVARYQSTFFNLPQTAPVGSLAADRKLKPVLNDGALQNQSKQRAIYSIVRGVLEDPANPGTFLAQPLVVDAERLLQDADLIRIKHVIFRDAEESRQAQFLGLASVYFLSVMMVSRYRDILEPPPSSSPLFGLNSPSGTPKRTDTLSDEKHGKPPQALSDDNNKINGSTDDKDTSLPASEISSIKVDPNAASNLRMPETLNKTSDLPQSDAVNVGHHAQLTKERQVDLTAKLKKSLDSSAPYLREIFSDFKSFLQRTLLGTHGQEIMNDQKVVTTLLNKQASVVELVMLLCSQEWQTSLQKHAGLAFIELVNEGRLFAHATRDHVVRVASEAEFILNRFHAEDVTRHAEFEALCAQTSQQRFDEERTCDMLISAARRRDATVCRRILDNVLNILTSKQGAWKSDETKKTFRRLDNWEDDSRRRRRLVPNANGSSHDDATLKSASEKKLEDEMESVREKLALPGRNIASSPLNGSAAEPQLDEQDLEKWASDEREFEVDIDSRAAAANFTCPAKLISPGIVVSGILSIGTTEMSFDCDEDDPEFRTNDPKVLKYCEHLHGRWTVQEMRAIFLRRFLLQNVALDIFLSSRTAIMFAFADCDTVKKVVQYLPRVGIGSKYGLPQSRRVSLMSPRQLFKHSEMPAKWQRREISNFDYLMFLNTIAGRTYNDLSQYPVFPWILSNYESDELDLKQPSNFRDLSKPVGALNDSRRETFEERYKSWEHDKIPPFHYGTHYSTAAFTLSWLIRLEPFTTLFLQLQGGKFDHPDRTFHSLSESWKSCLRDTHDVKELIPELFYLPEMLVNENQFKFGRREDKVTVVDQVVLPKWAESAEHFITVHRQALESDLASCQLNQWIDLIFGYKQRGPEAVRATNVFYYLTYEGALDLDSVDDPVLRKALENQIKSFGQTPSQLLTEPHPPRQSIMTVSPMIFQPVTEDLCMVMKFISNSPIVHLTSNTYLQQQTNPTVISVTASLGFALNRWNHRYSGPAVSPTSFSVTGSQNQINKSLTPLPNLPVTVDPLLASGNPSIPVPKRNLGELFDQRVVVKYSNFVCTVDSKYILACGYPDYSIRVVDAETASTKQVIFGHKAVVTCMARSECTVASDFYLASGSDDSTVLLWHWNNRSELMSAGDSGESAAPKATLTGHDAAIVAVFVSAEHGLVVSSSKSGPILIHTTNGDLLRSFERDTSATARHLSMSRDCCIAAAYDNGDMLNFTTSGRLLNCRSMQQVYNCLVMSRDGEYLVGGSDNGLVSVVKCSNLELLYKYPPCDSSVRSIALAQNHRFILAGLASGALVVFNIDFNKWHYSYQVRYGGV